MFGFMIGIVLGLVGYITGGGEQAALWTSMFWLGWYGLWQGLSGIFRVLALLGLTGGGALAGSEGGLFGSLLGSLFGGAAGLLIMAGWIIRTGFLIGGSWLIYTTSVAASSWSEVNFTQFLVGGVLVFIGAAFFGSSSSSSSSSSRRRQRQGE